MRAALSADDRARFDQLWSLYVQTPESHAADMGVALLQHLSNVLPQWRKSAEAVRWAEAPAAPETHHTLSAEVLSLIGGEPPPSGEYGPEDQDAAVVFDGDEPARSPSAERGLWPDGLVVTDEELAQLAQEARAALLQAPALDVAEVSAAGWDRLVGSDRDTEPDALIRLRRPDGSVGLPTFQFDDTGPIPIVVEVNELLGARRDPWGAAAWWLQPSLWFPRPPASMIGAVPDWRLAVAAQSALTVEW